MVKKFRSCRELEAHFRNDDCKCEHYRKHFPNCKCESESVSDHSPCVVRDEEILIRTVFNPKNIDPDGRLKPGYFRGRLGKSGFSVDRLCITDDESLILRKRQLQTHGGHLSFSGGRCIDIRHVRNIDGRRLFGIYDTATRENDAHADICQNVYYDSGTASRKRKNLEIADQLRDIFSVCVESPSHCFPSGED